jgi:hypothetical protein
MSRYSAHIAILVLFGICSTVSTVAQAIDFSADQIEFNKHEPKSVTTSKVYASASGVRMENNPGQAGEAVWITNYRAKKVWIVRPPKKIYAEEVFREGGRKGQAGASGDDDRVDVSTLMDKKPCDGFDKSRQFGMETISGRKTAKWACGGSRTQATVMQWCDADLKMVIREQDDSGQVGELRNIRLGKQPDALFQVTAGYRKVSMQELFPVVR